MGGWARGAWVDAKMTCKETNIKLLRRLGVNGREHLTESTPVGVEVDEHNVGAVDHL